MNYKAILLFTTTLFLHSLLEAGEKGESPQGIDTETLTEEEIAAATTHLINKSLTDAFGGFQGNHRLLSQPTSHRIPPRPGSKAQIRKNHQSGRTPDASNKVRDIRTAKEEARTQRASKK